MIEFVYSALSAGWVVWEILIAVRTQTRPGEGKIQDRGTQIILWVVIAGSVKINDWMHGFLPPDMPGSYSWLRPLAVAILILGLGVRATAIVTLGGAFSANVATYADQGLERSGLYRIVRHPSYLGLELIFLAFALHTCVWACFAVVLIPPTLAVLYRIHVEEIALRQVFGADYEDYSRHTKRLIPGVY
jgi:protein-S-isoprenylcysteine O-methyltransferase Ste14